MGFGRYLRRRGTRWFFRYRWPFRVARVGITGEFTLSLATADYGIALHRARILRMQAEQVVSQLSCLHSKAQAERLIRRWIDGCLWRQDAQSGQTDGFDFLGLNETGQVPELDAAALGTRTPFGPFADVITAPAQTLNGNVDLAKAADGRSDTSISRGYAILLTELREIVAAIPRRIANVPATPTLPEFPFLQFWTHFENHKVSVREWKADTRSNAASTAKLFDGFFPGVGVADVFGGSVASDFKERYLQLPKLYDKKKDWRGLSLTEIIEDTRCQKTLARVSTNSSNKHVSNLSEYATFLMLKKHVSADFKNPFDGLFSPRRKGRAARADHDMWPVALDRKFFCSAIYSGCKSIHRRFEPGEEIYRDALFWLPLLGRTMGAREDELCSRLVGDIAFMETEIGLIAYLKIRDSKTASSTRDVPFQDEVLSFGLLEYRYRGRSPDEPLFPELIPQGPAQRRSAAFTGRFAHARLKTGVLQPRVDFRSYRSSVQTVLSNTAGVNAGWIDELIGHDSIIRQSEGTRYAKGVYMSILKQTIDKVRLPVDLSHLKYTGQHEVPAPGAAEDIVRYVELARREMNKKTSRKKLARNRLIH